MPLVGDRVRLASRPHRALRRLLRRRLFAFAPAHAPAAAGRALQVVTRRFPSLCIRPRRPPSSPPLVATLIAAAAGRPPSRLAAMIFPFALSRYAAHNGVRNVIFSLEKMAVLKQKELKSLTGLRPAPRENDISHRCPA